MIIENFSVLSYAKGRFSLSRYLSFAEAYPRHKKHIRFDENIQASNCLECLKNTGKIMRGQNISRHRKSHENIVKEIFPGFSYNRATLHRTFVICILIGVNSLLNNFNSLRKATYFWSTFMETFFLALLTAFIWGFVPFLEKVGLSSVEPTAAYLVRCSGVFSGCCNPYRFYPSVSILWEDGG